MMPDLTEDAEITEILLLQTNRRTLVVGGVVVVVVVLETTTAPRQPDLQMWIVSGCVCVIKMICPRGGRTLLSPERRARIVEVAPLPDQLVARGASRQGRLPPLYLPGPREAGVVSRGKLTQHRGNAVKMICPPRGGGRPSCLPVPKPPAHRRPHTSVSHAPCSLHPTSPQPPSHNHTA